MAELAAPKLGSDDRWASCRQDEGYGASLHRHVVPRLTAKRRKGSALTSACGATAMPPDTWRTNHAKPVCPECVKALEAKA